MKNHLIMKLTTFLLQDRGSVALHYALIASGVGLAVLNASNHTGEKVSAQFEAVLSALQKQSGLQRLIP